MSGLSDSTNGISFGSALQFQPQIGTSGLNIIAGVGDRPEVVTPDGSSVLSSDGLIIVTGQ